MDRAQQDYLARKPQVQQQQQFANEYKTAFKDHGLSEQQWHELVINEDPAAVAEIFGNAVSEYVGTVAKQGKRTRDGKGKFVKKAATPQGLASARKAPADVYEIVNPR